MIYLLLIAMVIICGCSADVSYKNADGGRDTSRVSIGHYEKISGDSSAVSTAPPCTVYVYDPDLDSHQVIIERVVPCPDTVYIHDTVYVKEPRLTGFDADRLMSLMDSLAEAHRSMIWLDTADYRELTELIFPDSMCLYSTEAEVCAKRGHTPSTGLVAIWDNEYVCKYCGTHFYIETKTTQREWGK